MYGSLLLVVDLILNIVFASSIEATLGSSRILDVERDALMNLFGSTHRGPDQGSCLPFKEVLMPGSIPPEEPSEGWKKSNKWGSDSPVGEWFGVTTDAESGRVIRLDLSHNGLYGTIPDLSALESMQEMDLRGNSLEGTIPHAVGRMTSLTDLYLSANCFSGMACENV